MTFSCIDRVQTVQTPVFPPSSAIVMAPPPWLPVIGCTSRAMAIGPIMPRRNDEATMVSVCLGASNITLIELQHISRGLECNIHDYHGTWTICIFIRLQPIPPCDVIEVLQL